MSLEIISLGSGLSLQDGGRTGWLRYGVPLGGAMDRNAMHAANRLLGNRSDAPVLEVLMQGAQFKVTEETWIAVAGANSCPQVPAWTAIRVLPGQKIEFSKKTVGQASSLSPPSTKDRLEACPTEGGLFSYLAVPGGFVAEQWFGSVSVDPRNGLGSPLKKGDALEAMAKLPNVTTDGVERRLLVDEERRNYLAKEYFSLLPGPQFESFSPNAREAIIVSEWVVSAQWDRTGYRLEGPALEVPDAIPSEPVIPGSFQVPGNGQPIITMVDGPTVGGYAKIAVLKDADRDRLAQCAPGTQLCFQWAES